MRIAISAEDTSGLDSVVSPHFGRCPHYVLVDVEGQEIQTVQAVDNPYYAQHVPGQVPGFINSHGVNVMLTGGMGRRAIVFFEQYGIEAVTGASGMVRHALESYLGGELRGVQPCRAPAVRWAGLAGRRLRYDLLWRSLQPCGQTAGPCCAPERRCARLDLARAGQVAASTCPATTTGVKRKTVGLQPRFRTPRGGRGAEVRCGMTTCTLRCEPVSSGQHRTST